MNLFEIFFLAIALGIDCLIVSFAQSLILTEKRNKTSIQLAISMGFFQGIMPIIGFLCTTIVFYYIEPFAKWLVFGIFLILGCRCLMEIFAKDEEKATTSNLLSIKQIILLGIATSIDALGAGVSLKLTHTPLLLACLIIGIISFIMSILGFKSGCCLNKSHTKYFEIFAGFILIFLAVKSLG